MKQVIKITMLIIALCHTGCASEPKQSEQPLGATTNATITKPVINNPKQRMRLIQTRYVAAAHPNAWGGKNGYTAILPDDAMWYGPTEAIAKAAGERQLKYARQYQTK